MLLLHWSFVLVLLPLSLVLLVSVLVVVVLMLVRFLLGLLVNCGGGLVRK